MTEAAAKRFRLLASVFSMLVLVAAGAGTWFYFQLRASLPQLDGTHPLAGLTAPVTATRDVLGVPTIRGATRPDVARALGFLHAQDRFFQMDLLRRRAAGELAELFGKVALPLDRSTRPHRFRALAQTVLAQLPAADRALLDAYTAGANAGLAALAQKPFEYLLLRTDPKPWLAEDSLLVVYALTLDLQDADNVFEHSLSVLRDQLGTDAIAFFCPLATPDDAALDATTAPLPPIPGPKILNLRDSTHLAHLPRADHFIRNTYDSSSSALSTLDPQRSTPPAVDSAPDLRPGSNSFALTGAHTANGAALLANDPHLRLAVPNIWYRAVLEWTHPSPDPSSRNAEPGTSNPEPSAPARLIGATLPGLPLVILGSNTHIAWGLTVAYADTADLVAVEVNAVADNLYKIPGRDDLLEIQSHHDVIHVKGAPDETVESSWTVWGPIIGHDSKNRPLVQHWTAHDPAALNLEFLRLETATSVAEALDIAHRSGTSPCNFLVTDTAGAIGWTVVGRLPKRVGFDGRLPASWSFGDRRWDGFVPPDEVPTITSAHGSAGGPPASAPTRLWTANNRLVGGPALAVLGDAGYDSPPRAAQIRDDLAALEHATPRDLLAIQLDDRALFLTRWQKLLLATLTPEATAKKKSRAEFRRLAEPWEGRAAIDSISYRLVRAFRDQTARLAFTPIFESCTDAYPAFNWHAWNYEPALWTLLTANPPHLLDPAYADWNALLLAAVDAAIADLDEHHTPLDRATWGARNTAKIRHPFGSLLPLGLGAKLNLPADPLPGDSRMPRVQSPDFGASLRLVVSPGHEDEALFEMPGGESGHPLSPFYRAGHEAWVRGDPTPLLPGPAQHTLTLTPP